MKDLFSDLFEQEIRDRGRRFARSSRAGLLHDMRTQAEDGFTCRHCGAFVSSAIALAGVVNRNHCPYCVWSRHLDLDHPGDRLSACKAPMRPVGLAQKRIYKKYGSSAGELMLVHRCTDCARISLNRLAADDDPEAILAVFESSLDVAQIVAEVQILGVATRNLVHTQLFGRQ